MARAGVMLYGGRGCCTDNFDRKGVVTVKTVNEDWLDAMDTTDQKKVT